MMKKVSRIVCLLIALAIFAVSMAGCGEKEPGLYAWYGGKMDVDTIATIRIGVGETEKTYDVPFDLYRNIYVYLKGIVTDVIYDAEENPTALATDNEKSVAIKEVTEDTLMSYYSLVALCEDYGITITDEDKQAYEADLDETLAGYIRMIENSDAKYDGTKEEYAQELYRKTLLMADGMTPEYQEFLYYKNLLDKRLKLALAADLDDYLQQTYYHYKQVYVSYTKGDSQAEAAALEAVTAAREELLAGADIDDVIKKYGDTSTYTEIYFDCYGNIVGSKTSDAISDTTAAAVKALQIDEISGIMSGDSDDISGYFAVYQKLGFDTEYICGESAIAKVIYNYPYVNSKYATPQYTRYLMLTESYAQNTSLTPSDKKVYDRIAVNTLY